MKIFFRNEGKIEMFSDKQKLKNSSPVEFPKTIYKGNSSGKKKTILNRNIKFKKK